MADLPNDQKLEIAKRALEQRQREKYVSELDLISVKAVGEKDQQRIVEKKIADLTKVIHALEKEVKSLESDTEKAG